MLLNTLPMVVYRSFPTSNHNSIGRLINCLSLYIVRFLHQTTTLVCEYGKHTKLYIVRFLHQTTTGEVAVTNTDSCISFVSYIKPQPHYHCMFFFPCCISFVSYIKPQPSVSSSAIMVCCISFVSYIKPQQ